MIVCINVYLYKKNLGISTNITPFFSIDLPALMKTSN